MSITEDPCYNDSICPQDFAVKKNLPIYRIPTCTIINDKKPFSSNLLQETCCGYLLEWPWKGDSNKYPQDVSWCIKYNIPEYLLLYTSC